MYSTFFPGNNIPAVPKKFPSLQAKTHALYKGIKYRKTIIFSFSDSLSTLTSISKH